MKKLAEEVERVTHVLPKDLVEEIDSIRFEARHGSRSETIRELLRDGVEARRRRRKTSRPSTVE